MVITVVNIMLPRVTVLKIIVFQQSFILCGILSVWVTVIDYSQASHYLLISLPDLNLSHSNDFSLYCTNLSNERFLENEGFFEEVRVNEFLLI